VAPDSGALACGYEGPGRLPDADVLLEELAAAFSPQDLAGESVLVTAGPTREYLDPVRFLSNRSSGKMGFAVARAAARRGAPGAGFDVETNVVTLIDRDGTAPLPLLDKDDVADAILDRVVALRAARQGKSPGAARGRTSPARLRLAKRRPR